MPTETQPGTEQDALRETVPPSDDGKDKGTETTPTTWSDEDYQKILGERESAIGRHKSLEEENRGLQSQLGKVKKEVVALQESMLDKNDPKATDIFKLKIAKGEVEDERDALKAENEQLKKQIADGENYKKGQEARTLAGVLLKDWDGVTVDTLVSRTNGTKTDMLAFLKEFGKPKDPTKVKQRIPDTNETDASGNLTLDAKLRKAYPEMFKNK